MPEIQHPNCYKCNARLKSVFCELNPEEIQLLNSSKKHTVYKKGQVIFNEGVRPRGLFCVHEGKVKITQLGVDGKEQIIHLAKDGDILGYRAILSNDNYSCTATAIENSSLCFVPSNLFTGMVEKNPKLTFEILRLFSNELKVAERNITDLAQKSVKERLAQSILLLKESYGFEKDSCTINITITREEIASIVGTARETIIRFLSELHKDKVIELTGKKIKIIQYQKLIMAANIFD